MRRDNCLPLLFATAIVLCLASWAWAHNCFCAHCGHSCPCQKVCRLVCEDKKIEVVCWGALCEEFCVPCHGKKGCEHCEMVCSECDCDPETPTSKPKRFIWSDWMPTRATMFTRTKLMKKTITKEVPTYKWVVEDLCQHCEANCPCASIEQGAELPPVPVTGAPLLYRVTEHPTQKRQK